MLSDGNRRVGVEQLVRSYEATAFSFCISSRPLDDRKILTVLLYCRLIAGAWKSGFLCTSNKNDDRTYFTDMEDHKKESVFYDKLLEKQECG
jgi:hypothetical protein